MRDTRMVPLGICMAVVLGIVLAATPQVLAQEAEEESRQAEAEQTEAAEVPEGQPEDRAVTQKFTGEIVVTAQKREQSLMEVPVAATAIPDWVLTDLNYTASADLQFVAPSLKFAEGTNRIQNFSVRGIGTFTYDQTVEPSVGVYLDGVAMGQPGMSLFDLLDLERVEVLRGPQGTLFGKSSTAGLVHVITQRPRFASEFKGRVSYGARETNPYQAEAVGVGNVAISDELALRVGASVTSHEGFVHNVYNGEDLSDNQEYGFVAKLLWQPSDNLDFLLRGDYSKRDSNFVFLGAVRTAPPGQRNDIVPAIPIGAIAPVVASETNEEVNHDGPDFNHGSNSGVSLEINYRFGDHTLTSISAYRTFDYELNADSDALPINILNRNFGIGDHSQFSEEVRIAGPQGQRVDYVAGAYVLGLNSDTVTEQVLCAAPGPSSSCNYSLGRLATPSTESLSVSGFGDINLHVTNDLTLIAGARYTNETLEGSFLRVQAPGSTAPLGTAPFAYSFDSSEDFWAWRFGAQYSIVPEVMVYGMASRAVKGQAANTLADFESTDLDDIIVDPEQATSYELGLKSSTSNGRLTTTVALFDTSFKDFQAQLFDTTLPVPAFVITNAGEVATSGVEVDLQANPAEGLVLSGSLTYLDAETVDFKNASCHPGQTVEQGCLPVGGGSVQDLSGSEFGTDITYSLTASYGRRIASKFDGFVIANWFWEDDGLPMNQDPLAVNPSHGVFNVRLGVGAPDGSWQASVFAKNLFDEYFVNTVTGTLFFIANERPPSYSHWLNFGARRFIGVELSFRL